MLRLARILLAMALATSAFAQQEVNATVTGGVVKPLVVAAPALYPETADATLMGRDIMQVVHDDLQGTGLFYVIPDDKLISEIGPFDQAVTYNDWKGNSIEVLVKGSLERNGSGAIRVRFRAYDIIAGTELGEGLQFTGEAKDWRRMGHKIADAIYSQITGEGPYFDSKIVFVAEKGPKEDRKKAIAIMDYDGADLRYLTTGRDLVISPHFAANARDVIFTSYASGSPQVAMMNSQTGELSVIDELEGLAFSPRMSPDGKSVLASRVDASGNTDIYQIDLGTGLQSRLTEDPAIDTSPSFSPDGLHFAFESNQTGEQQIFIMPTTGGEAVQISKGEGRYATPVWSPKGDLIAFTKIVDGNFHIGVMNIDGTGERILTQSFIDEAPSWAPNGRALVFFRETPGEEGSPKLFSISLTGQNMIAIVTPEFASDPSWSGILN